MLSSARVRALRHTMVLVPAAVTSHDQGTLRGQRFAESPDEPRHDKAYGVSSVNPVFNPPIYECDDDVFDMDDMYDDAPLIRS